MCGEGRESPLVMMPSDPVFLRGVTHPSVKGVRMGSPPTQILNPTSTSTSSDLIWRKNVVPMKSGGASVFESTSKQRQQPVIHRKELVNTITAQFQLFAPLKREHIDRLSWHNKTARPDRQICV